MKYYLITLSVLLFLVTSHSNAASSNIQLAEKLSQCAEIINNESRLHCFDTIGFDTLSVDKRVKKDTVVVVENKKSPVVITSNVKASQAEQVDEFAKEQVKKAEEEQGLQFITATISKAKQLLRGQWVIYLENGQKWQQKDSAKMKLKVGDKVRLKKSVMGAILLYKEGSHRSIRVKRVK